MGKHQIRINTQNMDPGQSRNNVLFDLRGIRGDSGGGGQVYHNVKSISLKHMEIPTGGYIIDNYNNYLPLVWDTTQADPGSGVTSFLIKIAPGDYDINTLITELNNIFVPIGAPAPVEYTTHDIFAPVDSSVVYYKTDSGATPPIILPNITWAASSLDDRLTMHKAGANNDTWFSATNSLVTVNNHPGIIYNVIGLSLHTPVHLEHGAQHHTCSRLDLSSVRDIQMTVGNKLNNYALTRVVDNSGLSEYIHRDFFDSIPIDIPNGTIKYFSRESDYDMIYHTRGEGEAVIDGLRVAFYADILNDIPYEFNGLDWSATFEVEGRDFENTCREFLTM